MSESSRAPALLLPAFAVALGYHIVMQILWMGSDHGDSSGVCCDMVGYVLDANRWMLHGQVWLRDAFEWPVWSSSPHAFSAQLNDLAGQVWNQLGWNPRQGWYQLLAATLFSANRGEEFGFVLSTLFVALTQVALGAMAWRLGGPWAGALAAALYPLMPAVAWLERRVDVYSTTACVAAVAALALLRSASMTRPLPTAAFAGLAVLGACISPRQTDNVLLELALVGMAGWAWLRGLSLGRDAFGEQLPRLRALAFGVVVALFVGLSGYWLINVAVSNHQHYLDYVRGEANQEGYVASHARYSPVALMAYPRHIVELAWTRWNAVGLGLGALVWLVRGRGRAEILGWALFPLVALSLLSKKNPYYIYMIFPALSLMTALGVAALPWRPLRWVVGFALVSVAGVQHLARSAPQWVAGTPLATVAWNNPSAGEDRAFQSPNWAFELSPRPAPESTIFVEKVIQSLPVSACACSYVMVAGGNVQWGDFAVPLAMRDPCARLVFWPIPQAVEDTGVLLVGQANTPLNRDENERLVAIRSLAQERYTLVDRSTQSQGVLEIWRRDDAWFSNYCANHSQGR